MKLNEHCRTLLEEIGQQLDQAIFPVVHNGGLVLPGPGVVAPIVPGMEPNHEQRQKRASRSATGLRQRPEAWARKAGAGPAVRSRTAGAPAQVPLVDCPYDIDDAVHQLMEAYPGTRVWHQEEGVWLAVPSSLLPGHGRVAKFVVAVFPRHQHVRGWGFWMGGDVAARWIGPRHTNYPDGSICAFDIDDGTWAFGESLVTMMDIYSVWAVRQLYLEHFGTWPGPQSSSHPYERMIEFRDTEHCSCGRRGGRYENCCKISDHRRRPIANAVNFAVGTNFVVRTPPRNVASLALGIFTPSLLKVQ